MALDGIMLHALTEDLKRLVTGRISKIQNISEEEILLTVHTKENGTQKLVINVHSNTNRVYVTDRLISAQPEPSNFVMFLRKHISQGVIRGIHQAGFDRILIFDVSTRNELGDIRTVHLYLELMGKYANLIVTDENNVIMDALKRIPVYENSRRLIHPGARYELPDQSEKASIHEMETPDTSVSLVEQISGFSPLLSQEVTFRLKNGQSWNEIRHELLTNRMLYIYDRRNFHILPLTMLNKQGHAFPLMEGLAGLYEENEEEKRHKEQFGDLIRTVDQETAKQKKKLPKLEKALKQARSYEQYQKYGDLLFSYMGSLSRGKSAVVQDYETGNMVTIPLDEKIDIKANANKYYKKYHKMKRSIDALQEQIEICRQDLAYFEQLEEQLKHCSWQDAAEIRQELENGRYIMKKKAARKPKNKKPHILKVTLEDGIIYAGRNNLQNSYLTHKLARRTDYWFHVKGYHGSHVVLQTEKPTEAQIRLAAMLAAWFSAGKQSSSVPVDYTTISQLKKVPGSKAGFVTMKSYKTIYIDPDPAIIEPLLRKNEKQ